MTICSVSYDLLIQCCCRIKGGREKPGEKIKLDMPESDQEGPVRHEEFGLYLG